MTAIIALAGATFASPFVVKGDAIAHVAKGMKGDSGAKVEATETIVAGGFTFAKPESWGRVGAAAAESTAGPQAGTVVSGVCPGGMKGAACADGVQLTFVAYDGEHGELPLVSSFEEQLDATLPKHFRGFRKVDAATQPAADGTRWLRYEFTSGARREVLGVFRGSDGSGVVAVVVGPAKAVHHHAKELDSFLAGASAVAATEDDAAAH